MKTKIIYIIFLLFTSSSISYAQGSNKIFQKAGWLLVNGHLPGDNSSYNVGALGLNYGLRYNLASFGDNISFGIESEFSPAVSFFSNDEFSLMLDIPLMAGINIGAGSTYDTDNDHGFGLAFGLNSFIAPVFKEADQKFYINPVVQFCLRSFNANSTALRELGVRVGFGNHPEVIVSDGILDGPIISIAFTWSKYIGY